ncbi:MAG: response regulator, partial [Deltaproteobacteria bacterium]
MKDSSHAILIIDDEIENLKALERTLAEVVHVHTAASGREGLEIINKQPIQLVICDQRMPEMTGIEFFKALKKSHPDIIRIILTGYTDVEDLIEAINEVGLYRYITKPWDNREIQLMIRRALEYYDLQKHNVVLVQEL